MRRAAHVDGNHGQVVAELRRAGIGVLSLAAVGNGVPDLLCSFRGVSVLLEVKNPDSDRGAPSKVSAATTEFIAHWPGLAYVVWSPAEAVQLVVEAARPTESRVGEPEVREIEAWLADTLEVPAARRQQLLHVVDELRRNNGAEYASILRVFEAAWKLAGPGLPYSEPPKGGAVQ